MVVPLVRKSGIHISDILPLRFLPRFLPLIERVSGEVSRAINRSNPIVDRGCFKCISRSVSLKMRRKRKEEILACLRFNFCIGRFV